MFKNKLVIIVIINLLNARIELKIWQHKKVRKTKFVYLIYRSKYNLLYKN
jgi:hypothetical protein